MFCAGCGFRGSDADVGYHDAAMEDAEEAEKDAADVGSQEGEEAEEEDEGDEEVDEEGTEQPDSIEIGEAPKKQKFVSRKKQRKQALAKLKMSRPKVDFEAQKLYMQLTDSNSALLSGRALRRVLGVFKLRDEGVFSSRRH